MNRMKKTTIIWGMVIIGLFILLTLFGFLYKNKANVYKELENKLVEAEKSTPMPTLPIQKKEKF